MVRDLVTGQGAPKVDQSDLADVNWSFDLLAIRHHEQPRRETHHVPPFDVTMEHACLMEGSIAREDP
jgi:hypothetical protein